MLNLPLEVVLLFFSKNKHLKKLPWRTYRLQAYFLLITVAFFIPIATKLTLGALKRKGVVPNVGYLNSFVSYNW